MPEFPIIIPRVGGDMAVQATLITLINLVASMFEDSDEARDGIRLFSLRAIEDMQLPPEIDPPTGQAARDHARVLINGWCSEGQPAVH
jgi:hypothetical protein